MTEEFELDFDRTERLGFPEVIFGTTKSLDVLKQILDAHIERSANALVTKLQPEKGNSLASQYQGSLYDELSGAFILNASTLDQTPAPTVAILSAGTSDAYIANEAYYTLAFMGVGAKRVNDVGVAGIHRLLKKVESLKTYKALIVIAGFEGALPTAVGGLLSQPIIAVPASVGYGVAEGGHVALNAMLSSCANGITVVNIDNGYGAAMAALRIVQSNQS